MLSIAQVSNMILARGVAGSVPPFSIAFFRWSIVAIGLSPLIVAALRQHPGLLRKDGLGIAAAGFLGMFVCGGPVYLAVTTTSAINLALIMAMAPLAVLFFSLVSGLESVNRWQVIGMAIALAGAVLVITRGQTAGAHGVAIGDLLVFCAMLAWAGYTMVQNRVSAGVGFLARIGMFAAAGALFSLPSPFTRCGSILQRYSVSRRRKPISLRGWCPACLPIPPTHISARRSARSRRRSASISGPWSVRCCRSSSSARRRASIHLIGGTLSLGGMWLSLQAKPGAPR